MKEIYTQLHAQIMDADRIPFAIAALFLTIAMGMISGPIRGNANPFIWQIYDGLFGFLGDRMDNTSRQKGDLVFRGFLLTCLACVSSFLLGKYLLSALGFYIDKALIELVFVSICISSGAIWFVVLRLYFALQNNGSARGAFYGLSRSSRIDLNSTDDFGITRTGLCFLAVSFDKGLVAPLFWYLVGGIPVLSLYTCLAAMAWRFGKCGFTKGFGSVPLALERLMGMIPSLLAGVLFTAASSFTPTARFHKSLLSWWAVHDKAPYEQGGIPVSAIAWPLHISLGGPVQDLSGSTLKNLWVGPSGATAQLNSKHLQRGLYINIIAHLLFLAALSAAYVYSGHFFT